MSLAVVVLVVLAALVPSVSAATSTYSLCYILNGLPAETLDDPFSIAVELTGSYNTKIQKSALGNYTQLLTATGTRQTLTRNGVTASGTVTSLVPTGGPDGNDNRLYLNPSVWFDEGGVSYNLGSTTEFPGKQYGTMVNVFRDFISGGVLETATSGIDTATSSQQIYVNGIPQWTANGGASYTAGNCIPDSVDYQYYYDFAFNQPQTYTADVSYHLAGGAFPSFTIDFTGTFTSSIFLYSQQDTFGDQYLTIVSATGTRKYCAHGSPCVTSQVSGVAPVSSFELNDNFVFAYAPYLSYYGVSYTLSTPVSTPGYSSGHNTSTVNIYISQTGDFLEGFPSGGLNSFFDEAETTYSLELVQN